MPIYHHFLSLSRELEARGIGSSIKNVCDALCSPEPMKALDSIEGAAANSKWEN
jgi:hypothetical protein